jgi:hypothetical protein
MSGIGHNSGEPAEVVRDQMNAAIDTPQANGRTLRQRRDDLIAAAGRVEKITDNDMVARAGDLQAMMSQLGERVEAREWDAVESFALGVKAGQSLRLTFIAPLEKARLEVRAKVEAFRTEQRDLAAQQQREQDEQQRAARAAKAAGGRAAAPAPSPPVEEQRIALPAVRGDLGSRTGDRKVDVFTIADPRKLDMDILTSERVTAAIQQACKDLYRVKKKIKGVVVTQDFATTVRK